MLGWDGTVERIVGENFISGKQLRRPPLSSWCREAQFPWFLPWEDLHSVLISNRKTFKEAWGFLLLTHTLLTHYVHFTTPFVLSLHLQFLVCILFVCLGFFVCVYFFFPPALKQRNVEQNFKLFGWKNAFGISANFFFINFSLCMAPVPSSRC